MHEVMKDRVREKEVFLGARKLIVRAKGIIIGLREN